MIEESRPVLSRDGGEALVRALLRLVVSFLLPALVAIAALSFLVPTLGESRGTWAEPLGRLGDEHTLTVGLLLFVGFSLMAGYWCRWLPSLSFDRSGARTAGARSFVGTVLPVAIAALLAVVLRGAFFGSYRVLSASMLPTLEPEDLLGGSRMAYGLRAGPFGASSVRSPARGDIVVFDRPTGVEGPDRFVKRVIGLSGDRIAMNGPHPVINGWEVPSCDAGPYVYPLPQGGAVGGRLYVEFLGDSSYLSVFAPVSAPFKSPYDVKPGEVFVLGDNRNNSSDSRSWNQGRGGGLPFSSVEARVKWWLLGVHRNGHVDLRHVGRPLDLHPRLEGIDVRPVRDGIERCLQNRPAETLPPTHHDT